LCSLALDRRQQRRNFEVLAAQATPADPELPAEANTNAQQPSFWQKLLKPIRDFGFGQKAFVQGGVGLFIYAGIGELRSPGSRIISVRARIVINVASTDIDKLHIPMQGSRLWSSRGREEGSYFQEGAVIKCAVRHYRLACARCASRRGPSVDEPGWSCAVYL